MAMDVEKFDFDNLSKDEQTYIRNTGNPELMRRAGLMEPIHFDLSNVPGSLPQHEIEQTPMPTFDIDGKVAEESVGDPGDPAAGSLLPSPGPEPIVETEPFEGSDTEKAGQAKPESAPIKTAAKKMAAKDPTS